MKKVLVMGLTSILGGIETYIYNLIRFIDKNEITFDFLLIGESKPAVFESEITTLLGKGHFYNAPSMKKNPIKAIHWLHNFYREKQYDVIYLNTSTSARSIYCAYAVNKLGAKLITHSHNGNASTNLKGFNNRVFRHYTTKISNVRLACSEVAYQWLFDDEPSNSMLIPNGIDTDRFKFNQADRDSVRKELGLEDKFVIGHVGRFSTQKNHKYFVNLAKILDSRYSFLLIGDGERKEELEELIQSNKLADKFHILPSQGEVEKYYSAMDVFAMPSLYEGLPIVAVEAQCNGLRCIFSDTVSRQADIIKNCRFIPISNVNDWIKAIVDVNRNRISGKEILDDSGFSIQNTATKIRTIIDNM